MNKATHLVMIDAELENAYEAALSIGNKDFASIDEVVRAINEVVGPKPRIDSGINIYELDRFVQSVNSGQDILTDVFICFVNIDYQDPFFG